MALSKEEREAIAAAKDGMKATGGEGEPLVQGQVIQGGEMDKTSGGAKVTVACNLPHGVRLRVFKMVKIRELVMGGGSREVETAEPYGAEVLIQGIATEVGKLSRAPIVAGYALTYGVDKDLWDAWLKDNKDSAMVRNHCIMAYEDMNRAQDWAKEHAKVLTGLEPLELENDPRRPRPASNLVGGVTTATEDARNT